MANNIKNYEIKMNLAFSVRSASQRDIVKYFKEKYNFVLSPTYITYFTQNYEPDRKTKESIDYNLIIRDRIYEFFGLDLSDFYLDLKEFTNLLLEKK